MPNPKPAKKKPAPKSPKPKTGKGLSAKVAAAWGVVLPERIARFIDEERAAYKDRFIFGMKGFGGAVKMRLFFGAGELAMYAQYAHDGTGIAPTAYFPLAAAGKHEGTYFVAVDVTRPELPVYFYDYESGFQLHAPDFETFLKTRLLKKGERTPGENLVGLYAKAKKLHAAKKYREAEAVLVQALPGVPEVPPRTFDEFMDAPANVMNLLGVCREKRGAIAAALKDYDRATRLGSDVAGLNICLYHKKRGDWATLIPYAEMMRARIYFSIGQYEWFWVRHYLGQAYLATGDLPKAVVAYHQIRKFLGDSDAEKMADAASGLQEIVKKKKPGAPGAAEILRWFTPTPVPLTDAARARLRAFWAKVPAAAHPELLGQVGAPKSGEPSDEVLSSIVRLRAVRLRSLALGDAEFLRDFERLNDLDLEGCTLSGLAAVAAQSRLEDLSIEKTGTKSLAPLAALSRLRELDCSGNPLESLDGLQSLKRLRKLRAQQTGIRDLGPLAGLPELERVTVYNNPVVDLSPLASCRSLKEISCFGAAKSLRGLPALKDLPRLEKVNGSEASPADVAMLRKLRPDIEVETYVGRVAARRVETTKADVEAMQAFWAERSKLGPRLRKKLEDMLEEDKREAPAPEDLAELFKEETVRVNKLGLKSLAALALFRSMDYLNAADNEIGDLGPLAGLAWLKDLLLDRNPVTSLAPLAGLKRLEELNCCAGRLTTLAGLESASTLRKLSVDQNQITDVSALRGCPELRFLAMVGNRIGSLEPLGALGNLEQLYAYDNAYTDLSPLAGCRRLQVVECFANPGLKNVLALKDLPDLQQVISHGALPADEVREFARLRPDVEID